MQCNMQWKGNQHQHHGLMHHGQRKPASLQNMGKSAFWIWAPMQKAVKKEEFEFHCKAKSWKLENVKDGLQWNLNKRTHVLESGAEVANGLFVRLFAREGLQRKSTKGDKWASKERKDLHGRDEQSNRGSKTRTNLRGSSPDKGIAKWIKTWNPHPPACLPDPA